MAIIPTYDSPQVQNAAIATPQARAASPDTFGASLGKGMETAASALTSVIAHNDQAQVLKAQNDMNDRWRELAYSQEVDPETNQPLGYLLRQGQAANGLEPEFTADMQENLQEIRDGLQSDSQRAQFDAVAQKHMNVFHTAINEHEFKQKMAFGDQQAKAAQELALNSIATDFQFPDLISTHIDDGLSAIRTQLAAKGIPADSDTALALQTEFESSAHKTVIDSLIRSGQVTTAKKYFDAFIDVEPEHYQEGDELPPGTKVGDSIPGTGGNVFTEKDKLAISGYLKPLADKQRGFDWVEANYTPGLPPGELDKLARAAFKDDVNTLTDVRQEIHSRQASYSNELNAYVKASSDKMYGVIAAKIQAGEVPSLSDIPAGDMANLIRYDGKAAETFVKDVRDYGQKIAVKTAEDTILRKIDKVLLAGGVPDVSNASKADWAALEAADPGKARELAIFIKQQKEHAADRWRELRDRPTPDQIRTYAQLLQSPQAIKDANLDQMYTRGLVTGPMVQHLAGEQAALNTKSDHAKLLENSAQLVDKVLGANGVTKKDDSKGYDQMFVDLADWASYQKAHGAVPTEQDYANKAKSLLEDKVSKGWWGEDPIYKTSADKINVPAADFDRINAAFARRGHQATPADIQQAYRRERVIKGAKK